jgi:ABC-type bacteriocin/lantibiotic exporter with double-glycine peptidase domain
MTLELALPAIRQQESWTCGPAALRSVLAFYGIKRTERHLARLCGTSPGLGTAPAALGRVARRYGLDAEERSGESVDGLVELLAKGHPAILLLQAWAEDVAPNYGTGEDDGHYVVLAGAGHRRLVFMDPSVKGARATLSRADLERRWHDRSYSEGFEQWALVLPALEKWRRVGRVRRMG